MIYSCVCHWAKMCSWWQELCISSSSECFVYRQTWSREQKVGRVWRRCKELMVKDVRGAEGTTAPTEQDCNCAELTSRPRWWRMSLRQRFTKLIKSETFCEGVWGLSVSLPLLAVVATLTWNMLLFNLLSALYMLSSVHPSIHYLPLS